MVLQKYHGDYVVMESILGNKWLILTLEHILMPHSLCSTSLAVAHMCLFLPTVSARWHLFFPIWSLPFHFLVYFPMKLCWFMLTSFLLYNTQVLGKNTRCIWTCCSQLLLSMQVCNVCYTCLLHLDLAYFGLITVHFNWQTKLHINYTPLLHFISTLCQGHPCDSTSTVTNILWLEG